VLTNGVALPLPRQYLVNGYVDQGVDYAAPGGTPEYAMGDGVIIGEGISGFGPNAPILKITSGPLNGMEIYYGHAGPDLVHVGEHVHAGQQITIIGYGIVGISTGPHLEVGFYPPGSLGAGSRMLSLINSMLSQHPSGRAWGSTGQTLARISRRGVMRRRSVRTYGAMQGYAVTGGSAPAASAPAAPAAAAPAAPAASAPAAPAAAAPAAPAASAAPAAVPSTSPAPVTSAATPAPASAPAPAAASPSGPVDTTVPGVGASPVAPAPSAPGIATAQSSPPVDGVQTPQPADGTAGQVPSTIGTAQSAPATDPQPGEAGGGSSSLTHGGSPGVRTPTTAGAQLGSPGAPEAPTAQQQDSGVQAGPAKTASNTAGASAGGVSTPTGAEQSSAAPSGAGAGSAASGVVHAPAASGR
jgi:hypothetical protein